MITEEMTDTEFAREEARMRRRALRLGYQLVKSHRRDERYADYGMYNLLDADNGLPYLASCQSINTIYGSTLHQVGLALDRIEAELAAS
jgi:hypothetical protein